MRMSLWHVCHCHECCVLFSLQSDTCLIDGKCHAANEASPSDVCLRCLPNVNDTVWTYGKLSSSLSYILTLHHGVSQSALLTELYTITYCIHYIDFNSDLTLMLIVAV